MIALRAAIRWAPSANDSVTTAGSDSGMAATASEIAVTTISSSGRPRKTPSASAGITFPASMTTRSPGTTSAAGTVSRAG